MSGALPSPLVAAAFALTGLPLPTLVALGGGVAALTVVLYILKLRRRPVAVAFSPLWQRVLMDKESSQLFSQLRRWLSLLLQLLLVALLVLALGDPRRAAGVGEGRNIVALVDASASMQATDVAPTRLEAAKRELGTLIGGLGPSDRMLIARMDSATTPLSTLTSELPELRAALAGLRASDTRASLERGLFFALDTLRALPNPEILVLSDGALEGRDSLPPELDLSRVTLSFVGVGKSGDNLAITGFSARRYPLDKSRCEVMLELSNTTGEPKQVELTLLGDGQVVDVTRLSLRAGETMSRFYPDLGGASQALEARLRLADGSHDALPSDDVAYALMPERRRAKVLTVGASNTYLEAALLLDEYLDVESVTPEHYPPSGSFDVTIFDGVAPKVAPTAGALLYLGPPEAGSPVEIARGIEGFGFDVWDRKSPLLRWMAVENIQVARGTSFAPTQEDRVVGASEQGPILVEGRRDGRRFVALGFDPRQSDMVLRVSWPLFLLNAIGAFVETESGYVSSFRTGEVWRIPAPSGASSARLLGPDGSEREVPIKEGHAITVGDQAGFYTLSTGSGESTTRQRFAANLSDRLESHIEPVRELHLGTARAEPPHGFGAGLRQEPWLLLVAAVAALSVVEWLSYHRRWTV